MTPSLAHVAARMFNEPLMIHAGKAAKIAAAVGPRILGATIAVEGAAAIEHTARGRTLMGLLGDPMAERVDDRDALYRHGPVAIVAVEGTLIHKGKWIGTNSGDTSYEGLHRQFAAALRDPSIRGVVIEVDSYGGEVSGAFDCADHLAELSAAKPTIAICTDHAYSAGYLLASAARQIVVPPSGGLGSIGVVTMHVDFSERLKEDGIKVTVLSAGKHKAEGNQFEPLPDAVAKKILADIETVRRQFAAAVGRYRGSRLDEEAAMATEAECYLGADAVKSGLADLAARPSEAFAAFVAAIEDKP